MINKKEGRHHPALYALGMRSLRGKLDIRQRPQLSSSREKGRRERHLYYVQVLSGLCDVNEKSTGN
ncbi:hypothetical protein [Paenibacillus larvae]